MKLIKNICMIGVAATLLSGCRGDLMDLNPYSSISSGNMWTSENLADMGVTGIYNTCFLVMLPVTCISSNVLGFRPTVVTAIMR